VAAFSGLFASNATPRFGLDLKAGGLDILTAVFARYRLWKSLAQFRSSANKTDDLPHEKTLAFLRIPRYTFRQARRGASGHQIRVEASTPRSTTSPALFTTREFSCAISL
jgi:hypothetical protein